MAKYAAHHVVAPERNYTQAIVETDAGKVKNIYPFTLEEPFTQWLGGTILIKKSHFGGLEAWHEGRKLI